MYVTAVILAAGRGRRMESDENKAFHLLRGIPVLRRTLGAFLHAPSVNEIVVVVGSGEEDRVRGLLTSVSIPCSIVPGGEHRRDSAIAGVTAATGEIVLIHDGARPFLSPELIERIVEGTVRHGACVPVLPIADTVRTVKPESTLSPRTFDRTGMVRIQTPQGFRMSLIRRALDLSPPTIPDDAAAVLALGEPVHTVAGEPTNLKITSPADVPLAEAIADHLASLDR